MYHNITEVQKATLRDLRQKLFSNARYGEFEVKILSAELFFILVQDIPG